MTKDRTPPQIEMRIDGDFLPQRPSWPARLVGLAVIVAVLAGSLAVAALALWLALALIPVALVAGLIAWAAIRFQLWRRGASFRGPWSGGPGGGPRGGPRGGRDPF